jgi:hypothetical protein
VIPKRYASITLGRVDLALLDALSPLGAQIDVTLELKVGVWDRPPLGTGASLSTGYIFLLYALPYQRLVRWKSQVSSGD